MFGTVPETTAAPCADVRARNAAHSICTSESFSCSSGDLIILGVGDGVVGCNTGGAAACDPGRGGNCLGQGSVGNGQPGPPVAPDFAGGFGACGTRGVGISFGAMRASFHAAARLFPSACW